MVLRRRRRGRVGRRPVPNPGGRHPAPALLAAYRAVSLEAARVFFGAPADRVGGMPPIAKTPRGRAAPCRRSRACRGCVDLNAWLDDVPLSDSAARIHLRPCLQRRNLRRRLGAGTLTPAAAVGYIRLGAVGKRRAFVTVRYRVPAEGNPAGPAVGPAAVLEHARGKFPCGPVVLCPRSLNPPRSPNPPRHRLRLLPRQLRTPRSFRRSLRRTSPMGSLRPSPGPSIRLRRQRPTLPRIPSAHCRTGRPDPCRRSRYPQQARPLARRRQAPGWRPGYPACRVPRQFPGRRTWPPLTTT